MKRILSVVLVFMLIGAAALAETVTDLMPNTMEWGISRTKFKEANGSDFEEVEIDGLKGLRCAGLQADGYTMDAYYEFAEKQGSYYGLSSAVYLLDVKKKVSDSELTKCFNALVSDLREMDDPSTQSKTSAVWNYSDCTIEITIGKYTKYNGSKNKTVAMILSAPAEEQAQPQTASGGKTQTMKVTAKATCSNYNHVGSSWTQTFTVNGKKLKDSAELALAAGDVITVKAVITEEDGSPDSGEGEESHTVTKSDLEKGFSVKFTVKVEENNGRYKGNAAKWSVSFDFTR